MIGYGSGRYSVIGPETATSSPCMDRNLNRRVRVHWVGSLPQHEVVRERLAALQLVRTPYLALIYDLVVSEGRVGIIEEELGPSANADGSALLRLYQFCTGLASLHERCLAHGALDTDCFRIGQLNSGRLCNLAFAHPRLDDPTSDIPALFSRLSAMGATAVEDDAFRRLVTALANRVAPVAVVGSLRDRLKALLLFDKHRALLNWRGTPVELGSTNRRARLRHALPEVASIAIEYDGTRFILAEVSGEVLVNNRQVVVGQDLPSSCVIALGGPHRPANMRYFVTFDQSHPEVLNAIEQR